MQVTVELFSYFRDERFKEKTVVLAPGDTITELLLQLQINLPDVGTIAINGKSSNAKTPLQSGDRVTLIPNIGGG